MALVDDADIQDELKKHLTSSWLSAKELQDRVADDVRIFRIKTAARQLEQEGYLERAMRSTKYGYPDEHYRKKTGETDSGGGEVTPIDKILRGLNEYPGIYGSLLVTDDGIVVSSVMSEQLDDEAVAALSSHMIKSIDRGLATAGLEGFERFNLRASHGRMVFVDIDLAYLVVVTRQDLKIDVLQLEIDSVSRRIQTRRAR